MSHLLQLSYKGLIKPIAVLIFMVLFFVSCTTYQVMEVSTMNREVRQKPEYNYSYVYQNDSLAIIYSFWAEKGVMAFAIYNKLDKPIYIDWKKASFVSNEYKLNYWEGKSTLTSVTLYSSRAYSTIIPAVFGGAISSQTISPDERITFIPPKSYYRRSDFLILPEGFYATSKTDENILAPKSGVGKEISARVVRLTYAASPIKFRNYITWSTKESFEQENYVDNEFYVSRVTEIKKKNFQGFDKYGRPQLFFERNDRYYIKKP